MQNIKKILQTILVAFVVIFIFGYLIVTAVLDLTNKEDVRTMNFIYATEFLELEHSINGLIPIGTDYYYLGFDEDYNAYTIHAGKHWAEDNFSDFDPDAEVYSAIAVRGLFKKVSDFDLSRELESMEAELQAEDIYFPSGALQCLEVTYIRDAWLRILAGVLFLALVITGVGAHKLQIQVPKFVSVIYGIVLLIDLVLLMGAF